MVSLEVFEVQDGGGSVFTGKDRDDLGHPLGWKREAPVEATPPVELALTLTRPTEASP
jgi:hypothetical protein